ncbi:MAG: hypothetical protein NVS4B8_27760 [Herpetosiphon sp.]
MIDPQDEIDVRKRRSFVERTGRDVTTRSHDLAVGSGAILGVYGRYLVGVASQQHVPATLPYGTLLINLAGCFLIGVLQTLFLELMHVRIETRLFVVVGMLGGFTTFSTFGVETVQLIAAGRGWQALVYQVASVAGGIVAVVLGIVAAYRGHRRFGRRS